MAKKTILNRWSVAAVAVVGCTVLVIPEAVAAPRPFDPSPDVVGAQIAVRWNVLALRTTTAAAADPPQETRALAIVQAAVLDAVTAAVDRGRPYAVQVDRPRSGSGSAATVAAAHDALVALYPRQRPALDAEYADDVAALPAGDQTTDGLAIGRATASAMLALRTSDRSALPTYHAVGEEPGQWPPTSPRRRPATERGWGGATPFVLGSRHQFRPAPPPQLGSARYARDYAEVHAVGSTDSSERTPTQGVTAQFWVASAPQQWNQVVQQLAFSDRLSLVRTAEAFALLNLAGADAVIGAWDAKFAYTQQRPVTAIRAAENAARPAPTATPRWSPLLATPPSPDYPAADAVYAGAAETVLASVFGRCPGTLILSSATAPGVVQVYDDFRTVATEVVDAQVWGGVHWRTSAVVGRKLGHRIGSYVVEHRSALDTGSTAPDE
ncbi:MAG TPA: vanadium-dependent haloperoxidase [Microlunatus sp.]